MVDNCPLISDELQTEFVVDIVPVEGQCCPTHNVVACKVGDEVYKVQISYSVSVSNLLLLVLKNTYSVFHVCSRLAKLGRLQMVTNARMLLV